MVSIFLAGLFLLFITSISPYGAKWAHIVYPIYLSSGLLVFSVFCFNNKHSVIGAICLGAMVTYLSYLFLDFQIGERSNKKYPAEWVSSLGLYPVIIAIISLLFLPRIDSTLHEKIEPKVEKYEYYANCTEAREYGVTPIYEGQPGYRGELDRDSDGIACE